MALDFAVPMMKAKEVMDGLDNGWLVEDESLNGDGELKMMEARWSEKKIVDYGGVRIERDSKKKRAKDGLNKRLVSN
ncbi:hypothetical protein V6N13_033520 [Hibiscus sabdariffa]|uniref:Uncharacterized protein n=1 Tax=Hibiscus sabdariffa TaxID=183260 RepID=A0ABR2FA81_9ROSI